MLGWARVWRRCSICGRRPGPELLTSTGLPTGIAKTFTNPLQRIDEDFGSARLDHNFSNTKDSLAAVYTVDDSRGNTPTNNPITFDQIYLREQVASVSETRVFSSSLVNRATFGFSRGAFYFNSGTTVSLPGWIHAGQPVGALVVGGGTTLNGASQITNGGTNAGSNLTADRNLFTAEDQVSYTRGKHLLNFGVWFERVQNNDTLVQDQYGQLSFTNLQTFLAGTVSTYTYAPAYTPLNWRSLEGAAFAEDTIKLTPNLELRLGFRAEFTNGMNEANGRASNYYFTNGVINSTPTIANSPFAANPAKFLPEPRIGTRLVAVRVEEDRDPRGLRHLLPGARQSELPAGSKRSVQYRLRRERDDRPYLDRGEHQPDDQLLGAFVQQLGDSQRRGPQSEDADGGVVQLEDRA